MDKIRCCLLIVGLMVAGTNAQMIWFEGVDAETLTTGNLLDEVRDVGVRTNVQEIAGLEISARSSSPVQKLNVTSGEEGSLGINSDAVADVTDAFEAGEKMIISFNKSVQINRIDFNRLGSSENFTVGVDGISPIVVSYDDLANKTYGYFDTNLTISAGTEIEFFTTGASIVGLDGIDVTVLEVRRELNLSMAHSNDTMYVVTDFDGVATTNYILQTCTNLLSNDWTTVSGSISSDTNITVDATLPSNFFRLIVE